MGSISELVGALAMLGITRAWDTLQERKAMQEEVFVPFNLSRFTPQEQAVCEQPIAASSFTTEVRRISHALPTL